MSSKEARKKAEAKLRQTHMGEYMSKSEKAKGQKPTADGKVTKPFKLKRKMNFSFFTRGSGRDTEEYRNCYPGKKDYEDRDDNYRFYMNEISSKPDGDFIDNIHANWWDDYKLLERHHGYIQWLFPIRESGMNWHAQELQKHEIKKIRKNRKACKRVLQSYKMMLGFYGMKMVNETDGEIERAENWSDRFRHLNHSFHNYLRITRILKSLGELGYENVKANFVKFLLYEGFIEETLDNCLESCYRFWIGVIRDDSERDELYELFKKYSEGEVEEKRPRNEKQETKGKASAHAKMIKTVKHKQYDSDDSDIGLQAGMDMLNEGSDSNEGDDQVTGAGAGRRKEHELSDSGEDIDSQEMKHYQNEQQYELGSDCLDDEDVDVTDTVMEDNTEETPEPEPNTDTQSTDKVENGEENTQIVTDDCDVGETTQEVAKGNDEGLQKNEVLERNAESIADSENETVSKAAAGDNVELTKDASGTAADQKTQDEQKKENVKSVGEKDDGTEMEVE